MARSRHGAQGLGVSNFLWLDNHGGLLMIGSRLAPLGPALGDTMATPTGMGRPFGRGLSHRHHQRFSRRVRTAALVAGAALAAAVLPAALPTPSARSGTPSAAV